MLLHGVVNDLRSPRTGHDGKYLSEISTKNQDFTTEGSVRRLHEITQEAAAPGPQGKSKRSAWLQLPGIPIPTALELSVNGG